MIKTLKKLAVAFSILILLMGQVYATMVNPYLQFPSAVAAAPSFTDPTDIAGLELWYDASDLATITKDGSDYVSQWDDKSGNARHVTQNVAASQPLWKDNHVNSEDAIYFDGGDSLRHGLSLTGEQTAFVVYNREAGAATRHGILSLTAPSTRLDMLCMGAANANEYGTYIGGWQGSGVVIGTSHSIVTWISNSPASGGSIVLRSNGTQDAAPSGTRYAGDGQDRTFIGSELGSGGTTGDICEIIVYSSALGSEDYGNVETYLSNKWNITIASLPERMQRYYSLIFWSEDWRLPI